MAGPSIITITNPQVNSGETLKVYTKNAKTNIECYTNVEENPHTSATAAYSTRLSKGRNTGFKNPVHTIQGVYDLNTAHSTGANAPLDYEWILELIKRSDQKMTLTSDLWATTSNATGSITVMLKNYTQNNTNDNVVSYTLTFQEVNAS